MEPDVASATRIQVVCPHRSSVTPCKRHVVVRSAANRTWGHIQDVDPRNLSPLPSIKVATHAELAVLPPAEIAVVGTMTPTCREK